MGCTGSGQGSHVKLHPMTDRPAPARSRRRRGARGVAWVVPAVLVLGAGGYTAASATAALPEPVLTLAEAATAEFSADAAPVQAAVDAQTRPSAVGWLEGSDVWTNDETPRPLASITKLVTVLVGQERELLAPDADGPSYVWTAADVDRQDELLSQDGIAYPVPKGTEMTRRQMLTLALVPSANDFAAAYAYSLFGDNDGFVAAVADWADRNGFESLTITEPTGMDSANLGSASDIVRIVRLVLADPTLADLVATERATLPWGIGTVENTNPLLGAMPGVIGVKTGRTVRAGYSLASAAQGELAGRPLTRIAVVFGRETNDARAADSKALLQQLAAAPQRIAAVSEGEHLGTLTAVTGEEVDLSAGAGADLVLIPGEAASSTLDVAANALLLTAPDGAAPPEPVDVLRSGDFAEPGLWWRVTHPREVFGF